MAVLSKCVVGSSLVQIALGKREVPLSKLSELKLLQFEKIQSNTSTNNQHFVEIFDKPTDDKSVTMKNIAATAELCGKVRQLKDATLTSTPITQEDKDKLTQQDKEKPQPEVGDVWKIDFSNFTVDDQDAKTLRNIWSDCLSERAKTWGLGDNAEKLVDGTGSSIEFIDNVYQKIHTSHSTEFEQVLGKPILKWAEERASQTITLEQYRDIDNSTQIDLWTDNVKTRIFQKIVLSKFAPAPAGGSAAIKIDEQQQKDIAKDVADKIKDSTAPFGIDIMKSKGLLALLVSGLFMTACNLAWNFYQWKLKASSDVDNEEDDSTDPESDE